MTKRILITAGPVNGKIDDNKLVSNKARGLWAFELARYLTQRLTAAWDVDLVVDAGLNVPSDLELQRTVRVHCHDDFWGYQKQVLDLAPAADVVVLAAAVTNWIPKNPISGKMPTAGFEPGVATQNIEFLLVPRVIDQVRKVAPKAFIVGCKLTCGSTHETLISLAYETLLKGHCNVVVANDRVSLKDKILVFPDRSVHNVPVAELNSALVTLFKDKRDTLQAFPIRGWPLIPPSATMLYEEIFETVNWESAGCPERDGMLFGSVAVPVKGHPGHYLVSPREKKRFESHKPVLVTPNGYYGNVKPTLNAKLLIRCVDAWGGEPVVHAHSFLPFAPYLPYAPPGTDRDNNRPLPEKAKCFNITGHGFVCSVSVLGWES